MAHAFASHVVPRGAMQLLIDQRSEFLQGVRVPGAPGEQQFRNVSGGLGLHGGSGAILASNTEAKTRGSDTGKTTTGGES